MTLHSADNFMCIYQILNKINGKMYIGSAVNWCNRFKSHRAKLRGNRHPNKYLQAAWNKYWEQSFEFKILEIVDDKNKLLKCEQVWIDWTLCYQREFGYNARRKAESNLGMIASAETRAKLSKINMGHTRNIGHRTSAETKIKLSKAATGKIFSQETKMKIGSANKGKQPGRKLDKWPHELGEKCNCNECREKRSIRRYEYRNNAIFIK